MFVAASFAQGSRSVHSLRNLAAYTPSDVYSVSLENVRPFLAWSAVWSGDAPGIWVRFSTDTRVWTDWDFVGPEIHAADLPGKTVGQLRFEDAAKRYFQVRGDLDIEAVEFHFFSPGDSPGYAPGLAEESLACPCPLPPYQKRLDWCPLGNCPPNPNPSFTNVTHLIVHHSATSNTASDWAAVVRSFWDFHVNTNGWADIGYNWLIDPNGVLYEGRGNNVLGAHFCGTNGGTVGVCVIGTYTALMPTTAAQTQLRNLLAWKACDIGADPLSSAFHPNSGLTLQRISGHRDGCNTECPGTALYNALPALRQGVTNYIAEECAVSGVEDPVAHDLLISPNPAHDRIYIELPPGQEEYLLSVVQAAGGLVRKQARLYGGGRQAVEIGTLPPGAYFLNLQSGRGNRRSTVFIKR